MSGGGTEATMRFSTLYRSFAAVVVLAMAVSAVMDPIVPSHMFSREQGNNPSGAIPGIDTDGDGLKDIWEDLNRNGVLEMEERSLSDPYGPDTDGDGLKDGLEYDILVARSGNISSAPSWLRMFSPSAESMALEMAVLGANGDIDQDGSVNILDADSDDDGTMDGAELSAGTDPLDPDSDGDMVPDAKDTANGFVNDADGNGMDDDWEAHFGLDGPNGDPDGDKMTNLVEHQRGTDPTHQDIFGGHIGSFRPTDLLDISSPSTPVLKVDGIGARYLRVASFDRYTNGEWGRTPNQPLTTAAPEGSVKEAQIDLEGRWRFDMPVLPWTRGVDNLEPYALYPGAGSAEVVIAEQLSYSWVPLQSYNISYLEPSYDTAVLSESGSNDIVPSNFREVPSGLSDDVKELAESWETSSSSTYEKAMELTFRLWSRCIYSPTATIGNEQGATVRDFLFLTLKGNALDFSTAFAIMLRVQGVPTRVVAGYALGLEEGGFRTYLEGHFHIWVEVYIDSLGWVPFEVTPHAISARGGAGVPVDGTDPFVLGPNAGDGGGTLQGGGDPASDSDLDYDGDLVPNGLERELGTNPYLPDTDGDGLDDGLEMDLYGTDPLKKDTDGDWLDDGEEVVKGKDGFITDPKRPDSDGGGLWDGLESLSTPQLDPLDPEDDRRVTDIDGDGLDQAQEAFYGTDPLRNDTDLDGLEDGDELFTYWSSPLSKDTDGDGLSDHFETHPPEGRAFTNPSLADTDGDGLYDQVELDLGTAPGRSDTDQDGLSDRSELELGTDPLVWDTDSDGLPDGRETRLGTDPLKADTDGDGTNDGTENWNGLNPLTVEGLSVGLLDLDGDGLPDRLELELGTDPLKNDTDGDGLNDALEHFEISTDPLLNDSDVDGVSDGEEVLSGTFPRLNDSDGDGLIDGTEVLLGTDPLSRDTDRDMLSDGTEVLSGTDPLKMDTDGGGLGDGLEATLSRYPLNDIDDIPFPPDGDGDGLPDLLEAVHGTDPSKRDTDGDGLYDGTEILLLRTNASMVDTDQDEISDGEEVLRTLTDPLRADTDGDGLTDGSEVMDWGTDPLSSDTDADSLQDRNETVLGTDPLRFDTDGDGLSDGEEVMLGTGPLKADTDGGGAIDGIEVRFGADPLDPRDDPPFRDQDGDGLLDREEDKDLDGKLDDDETDPLDPDTDGDGLGDAIEAKGLLGYITDPRKKDTDGDGIEDHEEMVPGSDAYITDPTRKDTDGDGLNDGDEVSGLFGLPSSPSSIDGDGDNLSDVMELNVSRTDPLDPDTDGDGLPDGWIDGFVDSIINGIKDPGEYEDRDLDGTVDLGDWNGGEGPGETDPLDTDTDGGGVSDGDEVQHKPLPFDPLSPHDDRFILDSDGDGLPDIDEKLTKWNDPDTDKDGLVDGPYTVIIDGKEMKGEGAGHNGFDPTDPLDPDSDGDGVKDGQEVIDRTDPNGPDTDGDGLWDGYDIVDGQGRLREGERTPRNRLDPSRPYAPTDPLDPDTDDDGLLDGGRVQIPSGVYLPGEAEHGTDPHSPDTDGDGLTDGEEVLELGTDPLQPDTDQGGMPDGLEVDRSMDPLDPSDDDRWLDSDGDGLLNFEEKEQLYYPLTIVDWNGDGIMDHRPDPYNADTDGDGLSDGREVMLEGTNPLTADTDRDGLTDLEELISYLTDPNTPDTDGDSLPDLAEVTHVWENSYVDWSGDGRFDNTTDPNDRDTDRDQLTDGREVTEGTNPLDPGDPGSEPLPEERPIVIIETAPQMLVKSTERQDGAFKVEGRVTGRDGRPVNGAFVSVLLVPEGLPAETVLSLEANPDFRVGSSTGTDEGGRFTASCAPVKGTPLGPAVLYALTRETVHSFKLYTPSASDPVSVSVRSTSEVILAPFPSTSVVGSRVPLSGSVVDAMGEPIGGLDLGISLDGTPSGSVRTDDKGRFLISLELPTMEGEHIVEVGHRGGQYIDGSKATATFVLLSGPEVRLSPIPSVLSVGSVLYVNGTVSWNGPTPEGEVVIELIRIGASGPPADLTAPLGEGAFTLSIGLVPKTFPPGTYMVSASYSIAPGQTAINSSLSFTLLDRTAIQVPDLEMVRGTVHSLGLLLLSSTGSPVEGGTVRVNFPEASWLPSGISITNSTGWAVIRVQVIPGSPLGPTSMTVEQVVKGSEGTIVGTGQYTVWVVALSKLSLTNPPAELTLLDGMKVEGRLEDDNGAGIVGEGTIELLVDGVLVGQSDSREGGFLNLSHTVDRFTRTGSVTMTVRFRDLRDERAGWYRPTEATWNAIVRSRTYLTVEGDPAPGTFNLTVRLADEKGTPVGAAPIQFGMGLSYTTSYTDAQGNITLMFNGTAEGDIIFLRFPGDPSRFLIGTGYNATVPLSRDPTDGLSLAPFLLGGLITAVIAAVVTMYIRARKLRRDVEQERVERMERSVMYPFDPPGRTNKAVFESYRSVQDRLRAGGSGRPEGMTPWEYSTIITGEAPELKELDHLTKIFEEARYSDHAMSPHLMGVSKDIEQRLIRSAEAVDHVRLEGRISVMGAEPSRSVQRPHMHRMKMDHDSDLRELLGDKGVSS